MSSRQYFREIFKQPLTSVADGEVTRRRVPAEVVDRALFV